MPTIWPYPEAGVWRLATWLTVNRNLTSAMARLFIVVSLRRPQWIAWRWRLYNHSKSRNLFLTRHNILEDVSLKIPLLGSSEPSLQKELRVLQPVGYIHISLIICSSLPIKLTMCGSVLWHYKSKNVWLVFPFFWNNGIFRVNVTENQRRIRFETGIRLFPSCRQRNTWLYVCKVSGYKN